MDFRENDQGHGKVTEFHFFWSKDFVLFENWKNSPSHRAKICPQKAGLYAFLSRGKFKLVMKKSWKSHRILLPNFCIFPVYFLLSA